MNEIENIFGVPVVVGLGLIIYFLDSGRRNPLPACYHINSSLRVLVYQVQVYNNCGHRTGSSNSGVEDYLRSKTNQTEDNAHHN